MSNITRRFTAGIALLLIGLSLILAVNLTAPRTVRANPGVRYAAPTAQGSGNCSSWANACTLQTALAQAISGDEIWVKAGVHYPGAAGNREATFTLKNGVALYGGFAGTETSREQRDWQTNTTILSGDIDQDDYQSGDYYLILGDNAYHVVTGSGTNNTAVLDGFIIMAGQANDDNWPHDSGGGVLNDGGNPTLIHVTFSSNTAFNGGGMYNSSGSPTLTNVTFNDNHAYQHGGGMYNSSGYPSLTNVIFSSNSASNGGGMYNSSGSPTLTNVTFSGNWASDGGGMYDSSGSPTLTNVTFSSNAASNGGGMYSEGSPTLTNVAFSDNRADWKGGGMYSDGNPTLTDVTFNGNYAYDFGGGVYSKGSPTLTDVTFRSNSVYYDGGGMYSEGSPTLTNVTFSDNQATWDGGGMYNNEGSPTLTNVTFSGNSVYYYGGGMYNRSGSPTLTNVTFSDNQATWDGGGMYNWYGDPRLTNVTFSSNSAGDEGGGMYNAGGGPTLTNVTFNGNSAKCGGGMYNYYYSSPTLTNVTFSGNTATTGGGMYIYSSPTLTNVTFSGNTATTGGGMYNSGHPTLTNGIIWGNSADNGAGIYNAYASAIPMIAYSDIQGCGGSGGGWNAACGTDGGGNIDADPRFVNAANRNLRLQAGSPCIDAGNSAAVPVGVVTDLDGNPRLSGADVDMGAYEFQNPIPYYPLRVYVSGDGRGQVLSTPPGIECPGDCVQRYARDEVVTLTTHLSLTSYIQSWEGCDSINNNTCGVVIHSGREITLTLGRFRVLYAAPQAVGSGNCSSWANACTLQAALSNAISGNEIWVKKGVHYPGAAGNREATFTLKNGVALYGGFAGTETSRAQRNWWTNRTILSGDIDQNDNHGGDYINEDSDQIVGANAYHVVTGSGTDATAVLDGFIITAGQADGNQPHNTGGGMYNYQGSPKIANVTFSGNRATSGGGMYNLSSNLTLTNVTFSGNGAIDGGGMHNINSSPTLTNVTFKFNSASDESGDGSGGGMLNISSSPTLTNVIFKNNFTFWQGGGMCNIGGSPRLINVTFSGNSAEWYGGGMSNSNSSPTLTNTIIWDNRAIHGRDIYNYRSTPAISYSDIRDCGGSGGGWNSACGADGGGNIDAEPLFEEALGTLRLQPNSPCIDAGDNTAVPAGVTTDLDGYPRFVDIPDVPDTGHGTPPIVDMGAYEVQNTSPFVDCSEVTQIPQSQCQALVALYNATDGRNWRRQDGWLMTSTPCGWYGVGCASGNVDTLWLSRNGLSGTLPAEIGNLNALTYLDLSHNQLTGLSAQFGNLTALRVLHLHNNPLTGAIPDFMANLTALGTGGSWGAPLTFYNTNWCVPVTGPVPTWLAGIPHDGTGLVCGQPAGGISGRVTRPDGNSLAGIHVHLYRSRTGMEHEWLEVAQTTTAADGRYQFGGLGQGIAYRVYFVDPTGQYIPQYYNNQPTRDTATPVTVTLGITRTGVDAILRPPSPPVGEIDPGNGRVDFDPNDGTADIWQFGGNRSPITVTLTITCPGGVTPTNVRLVLRTSPIKEYPMTLVGANLYRATIPAQDVETAEIDVLYTCSGAPAEKDVGQIVLYDPSGIITDARSGAPVAGARVTLYYVPGWLPRTSPADTRPNTCESNLSRTPGVPWSQPAPVDLGVLVNPVVRPVRPAVSQQRTSATGYYGWDVPEGCWYVRVEAEGYVPLVSPVVGVPPEVTDLNLALEPIQQKIYLPLVFRSR